MFLSMRGFSVEDGGSAKEKTDVTTKKWQVFSDSGVDLSV